jgi:hypothetical protein
MQLYIHMHENSTGLKMVQAGPQRLLCGEHALPPCIVEALIKTH